MGNYWSKRVLIGRNGYRLVWMGIKWSKSVLNGPKEYKWDLNSKINSINWSNWVLTPDWSTYINFGKNCPDCSKMIQIVFKCLNGSQIIQ